MTFARDYICYIGLYLYKRCYEHKNCFVLKNNDFGFLRELKSMNFTYCTLDLYNYLEKHLK